MDFFNIFSATTRSSGSAENQTTSNAVQPEIEQNKASTPEATNHTLGTMSTLPEAQTNSCNISITEESNSSIGKFSNIHIHAMFLIINILKSNFNSRFRSK